MIGIAPELYAALEPFRAAPEDHVTTLTPNAVTERYERIAKRLNISCRFHDLRHYHCSVMVALGVPKEYIMTDMGHSTDGLYSRVYTHMFPNKTA